MEPLTAKPVLLKQANLALIRKVIRAKSTVTRAEIAHETKISSTTVRSLLAEMLQNGEIESIGYDESSGGRKAERYRLKPDRYHGAAFCILGNQIHGLLVDVRGEIVESASLDVSDGDFERAVIAYLDETLEKKEIKSIGVGVPGVVEGGWYWRKHEENWKLYKVELGERLARRYQLPVVMENDLNAIAIGLGRCYERRFPCTSPEGLNMAYIHFERDCISAGFITGGRVIRGCGNFAGELGLIPMEDGKLLGERIAESVESWAYIRLIVQTISWICGILNPQYIVLGGPQIQEDTVDRIREAFTGIPLRVSRNTCPSEGLALRDARKGILPEHMAAEILYSADMWRDYHEGMACLTAGRMFDEVQFIKEQP